jgi:hypothetical protein
MMPRHERPHRTSTVHRSRLQSDQPQVARGSAGSPAALAGGISFPYRLVSLKEVSVCRR